MTGRWQELANVLALRLIRLRSGHQFSAEVDRLLAFQDLQHIEVSADYYRPLFFIPVGVFEIGSELREKLGRREPIEPGNQLKRELRVVAVLAAPIWEPRWRVAWSEIFVNLADETSAQPFLRRRHCRVGISDEALPSP